MNESYAQHFLSVRHLAIPYRVVPVAPGKFILCATWGTSPTIKNLNGEMRLLDEKDLGNFFRISFEREEGKHAAAKAHYEKMRDEPLESVDLDIDFKL